MERVPILVAGGAGYIGSAITELLLERGYPVTVYDNLSHGYRDAVPAGARFVQGDVGDRESLEGVLRQDRIAAVIHMAAFIEVGESTREPFKYLENNTLRGVALLQAMEQCGVRMLVLSSTAAVYAPSAEPLREISPLAPASPYGLSKLYLERLLAWYSTRGLHYFALRYFNAAGATRQCRERHQPESHLIPRVLEAADGGEPIQIFGDDYATRDGTCVRDYIHVRDLAEAHLLALDMLSREPEGAAAAPPELAARALNVGNGEGFSVREVVAAAARVSGRPIPQVMRARRPGDVDGLVADAGKLRALGWQPQHRDLEAIVASAWEAKLRARTAARA
ncbi:MAG: UDP-glucose 4-epimerase GalE [Terriglobales bacterium]